ncbi:RTA1 like protein-domain-containing protein [Boeremia exigua]|uniref:RTA1 like protein-domain-containing protein n=1 Tax=Boeremia exigua TaxID=749465 RepID=UPI001E8D7075|nr:RTA1 like protein-domain-containing protein [Boeremia exigua]KAH6618831.1 RTA1 like protein-domain-containing protein [Boeremia exigua]
MAEESKYEYTPSVAAAAIFIVVFLILLVVHTFRLFKTRTWFCTSFVVGTILEIIGYGARAVGKSKPAAMVPYIIQALFILLAPILFAASVYMFLGRLIQATGCAHYSMIRPTRLTKIFVGGDVLCFLIQAVGTAILAGSDSKKGSDLGKAVILTGLCLQMAIFAFFVVIAAVWHRRVSALGSEKPQIGQWNWLRYQNMLYIVSGIITLRNLFRVIEYAMGKDGYLLANEWPIYVFDATLMAGVLVICSYWYIGPTLKQAADLVDSELEIIPQNSQ